MMIVGNMSNLATVSSAKLQTVNNLVGTSKPGKYFMNQNPDYTGTPAFNRQFVEQKTKLQSKERRLREMRKSDDLKLVLEQMSKTSSNRQLS